MARCIYNIFFILPVANLRSKILDASVPSPVQFSLLLFIFQENLAEY